MAYTREYLTAIDVGTTKVVTLVAKMDYATTEILASGAFPLQRHAQGVDRQPGGDDCLHLQIGARRRGDAGAQLPPAFVGITGSHLTSLNAAGTITREPGRHGSSLSLRTT